MILATALQGAIAQQNQHTIRVPMTIIDRHGGSCPPKEELDTVIKTITNSASATRLIFISSKLPQCGDGVTLLQSENVESSDRDNYFSATCRSLSGYMVKSSTTYFK